MEKSVLGVTFPKLIGIFLFLMFLGILNFLVKYIRFESFIAFTNFFNVNAIVLISIVVIFLFAELLSSMKFPSNIFGPILNFAGTWMILVFTFTFLEAIQRTFEFYFLETIFLLKTPIFFTILSLIFIFGYLPISYNLLKNREKNVELVNKPTEKIIEKIILVPETIKKVVSKEKIDKNVKSKKRKEKNVKRS